MTILYTTSLNQLCYSTASVSHPIPLSAANRFFRLQLSVSSGFPKWSWQRILRQTVPNCLQLTPNRSLSCTARAERDGTRAKTGFRLSPKRTSLFKSVGASVQSTAGSRGVRISLSNAGYTTFGGGVRVLATHSIRQFPLHFPSRASPCATRFRTSSTNNVRLQTVYPASLVLLYLLYISHNVKIS